MVSRLFNAAARGLATGVFRGEAGGTTGQPVSEMAFTREGGGDAIRALKNSDDQVGVDLTSGGTGTSSHAEFEGYMVAAEWVTIDQVRIGINWEGGESGITTGTYAIATVQRALVQDQKYTVRYRITLQAA